MKKKECIPMSFEAKAWKEIEGPCLRNFDEQGDIDSVNGALPMDLSAV